MTAIAKRDSMDATVKGLEIKLQAAQLNDQAPKKRSLGLADLPASVRNNIYKYTLDTELVNVGESNVSYTHSIKDGVLQFKASRLPFLVQTSLFYVNKQISKEALHYFYSKNLAYSSPSHHRISSRTQSNTPSSSSSSKRTAPKSAQSSCSQPNTSRA
jgi:hypothetical protein